MLIKLNTLEKEKITKLLINKDNNMSAAELYVDYLTNHRTDISKKEIDFFMKNQQVDVEKAFYFSFLKTMAIAPKRDLQFENINKQCHIYDMKLLSKQVYLNNPYLNNITFKNVKEDTWELCQLQYLPFEGFVYDELQIEATSYNEFTPIGFFDDYFLYPAVIEDDTIWMSVTPHEINTMKKSINDAKGHVLVAGLGLGYYAYMISNKDNVKSVTIIENDSHVIALFNKYILPQFPHQDKIRIILDDIYKYYDNNELTKYDYFFFDIYHNVGDGIELYLRMKAREHTRDDMIYSYWIEISLLDMLRRELLILFEEELDGSDDANYMKASDVNDNIINKLHFYLKNYTIKTADDLNKLISDVSLKEIASKLNYINKF